MCGPWLLPATASSTRVVASASRLHGGTEMILWPVASIAPVSRIAICGQTLGEMIASCGRSTAAQMSQVGERASANEVDRHVGAPASLGDQAPRFEGVRIVAVRGLLRHIRRAQQIQDLGVATLAVVVEKAVGRHRLRIYALAGLFTRPRPQFGARPRCDRSLFLMYTASRGGSDRGGFSLAIFNTYRRGPAAGSSARRLVRASTSPSV